MTRRAVLLKALSATPADVRRIVAGMDGSDTAIRAAVTRFVAAIADFEQRYRAQLEQVVQDARPELTELRLEPKDPGLDVALADMVDRFLRAREETLAFLNGLSPGDWQRQVVHVALGATSLRFLVQNLVEYDTGHLSQLMEARHGSPASTEQAAVFSAPNRKTRPNREEKDERKRARKWPRKRVRRGD
jgi:hypothetical protein